MCLLPIVLLIVSGCAPTPIRAGTGPIQNDQTTLTRYRFARVMMGSRCEITLEAPSESLAAQAAGAAFEEIRRIEGVLSDYSPNSESMLVMGRGPGIPHTISATLMEVLALSRDIHIASAGAYDPTVGPITHLWRSASSEGSIPGTDELASALGRVGFGQLALDLTSGTLTFDRAGMLLDFGGIGKGYAAQAALELLEELGYQAVSVDMGGDLALGAPPSDQPSGWLVEVVTGLGESRTINLSHCAIATSGDLERYYEHDGVRYSHIIDPRTGLGITQRRAVTVIAPNAALADALASAASVMGREGIAQLEAAYEGVSIELVAQPLGEPDARP